MCARKEEELMSNKRLKKLQEARKAEPRPKKAFTRRLIVRIGRGGWIYAFWKTMTSSIRQAPGPSSKFFPSGSTPAGLAIKVSQISPSI
jgi:hypothetical protein